MAVGDTGWDHPAIWFSADGVDWSTKTLPAAMFRHAAFSGLTLFRGRWVLTGLTDPSRCVLHRQRLEGSQGGGLVLGGRAVLAARERRVGRRGDDLRLLRRLGGLAAGGFGWTWLSADGSSWRPDPSDAEAVSVTSDGDRIIGDLRGDDDGLDLWVSADGSSWQALADAGDVTAKPSWNDGVSVFAKDYFLLPTGLAIIGWDAEDGTEPMRLATPADAP